MTEQPPKIKYALGEAMGVLIIIILLTPLTAICLRASLDILRATCEVRNGR